MQSTPVPVRAAFAAIVSVVVLLVALPPTSAEAHSLIPGDPSASTYAQSGGLLGGLLGGGSGDPDQGDAPSGGSGTAPTPPASSSTTQPVRPAAPGANGWTGPGPLVSRQVAVARLNGPPVAGVVMADRALPWTYLLDTALIDRFGEAALQHAVASWDGIPGSRWATRAGGTVSGVGQAVDGKSVIFLEHDCPSGVAGLAYLTPAGGRQQEYGDPTFVTVESDIAICAALTPVHLHEILRHEVGHVMGMAHLCDRGEACWSEAMGTGSQTCRIMYGGSNRCGGPRGLTDEDRQAARALYPTLRRAAGPTRIETSARASRGAHEPASAGRAFLVRGDADGLTAAATAAVAGRVGAPLLLAFPTAQQCVGGTAATELMRIARPVSAGGTVVHLVGSWPAACVDELRGRGHDVRTVGGTDAIDTALALADLLEDLTGPITDAVVVSAARDADGSSPDGIAAGSRAAAVGGPLLFTGKDVLDGRVASWLARRQVDRVVLVGGSSALTHQVHVDVEATGSTVSRTGGTDRIGTSLALAGLFARPQQVGIAAATSWADAASATAVAGMHGAPVLLTGPSVDERIEAWLALTRPGSGWVFGGENAIRWTTATAYTAHVG
jgi:hypothetical protein